MLKAPGKFTWEEDDIVFVKRAGLSDPVKNKEQEKEELCYPAEKNDIIPEKKDRT